MAKIREYHGSFKSICENFSISMNEYEQIFGMENEDESFKIWDTNDDQLIDALELFSGLILFSESKKVEEKIRCKAFNKDLAIDLLKKLIIYLNGKIFVYKE